MYFTNDDITKRRRHHKITNYDITNDDVNITSNDITKNDITASQMITSHAQPWLLLCTLTVNSTVMDFPSEPVRWMEISVAGPVGAIYTENTRCWITGKSASIIPMLLRVGLPALVICRWVGLELEITWCQRHYLRLHPLTYTLHNMTSVSCGITVCAFPYREMQ